MSNDPMSLVAKRNATKFFVNDSGGEENKIPNFEEVGDKENDNNQSGKGGENDKGETLSSELKINADYQEGELNGRDDINQLPDESDNVKEESNPTSQDNGSQRREEYKSSQDTVKTWMKEFASIMGEEIKVLSSSLGGLQKNIQEINANMDDLKKGLANVKGGYAESEEPIVAEQSEIEEEQLPLSHFQKETNRLSQQVQGFTNETNGKLLEFATLLRGFGRKIEKIDQFTQEKVKTPKNKNGGAKNNLGLIFLGAFLGSGLGVVITLYYLTKMGSV